MSDQATYVADLLLEDALDEIFHGGPQPELAERILRAASGVEETVAEVAPAQGAKPAPALSRADGAVAAETPLRLLPRDKAQGRPGGRRWVKWAIEGVVAAGIAALLVLIVMPDGNTKPNPPKVSSVELPAGVAATNDAQFTPAALGGGLDELQLERGWYVLTNGAPAVVMDGHRVEDVEGQVLVKVGEVPTEEELTAVMPWLSTHQIEEKDMSVGNWIKVGTLAVCVMAGSAFVDNQYVAAQDRDRKVEDSDRPAVKLEQLKKELEDLEAKLERARGMDDVRGTRQKIQRIENAIKEKKEQIAAAEERIRNAKGDDRKREGDRKDSDRREGDRKDSDRQRDDAERDRKAREDEATDRARKEDAARKERDAEDRKRKEREEQDRKAREENDRRKRDAERPKDRRKS